VARALAADPPILILDEAFGALDPITRSEMQKEFRALQRWMQKAVIFVTHDLREALFLADRIALMEQGRLVVDLPVEEFSRSEDRLVRAYVEAFSGLPDISRV
jgi:osmoprotectant transport system ATP-binding protein